MTAEEAFKRMEVRYPLRSLEDFLIGTPLNANAQLNDGWSAYYPVKGCELEATILSAVPARLACQASASTVSGSSRNRSP